MIARELIVEPDLILLDEPTNALDIESKISLLSLLEELEIGVGLITHDSLDHNFRRFKLEDGFSVRWNKCLNTNLCGWHL